MTNPVTQEAEGERWIDPRTNDIVKFFPNNPPEKGDIVLVNGNRCRVLKSEVRWDGRSWHLGRVKVESA